MKALDVRHINPFLQATLSIMEQTTGLKLAVGKPGVGNLQFPNATFILQVGVTGVLKGQVLLVMNEDNSYMTIAEYRYQTQYARPEQHFADRIADYWDQSKRCVTTDLRTEVVEPITPLSHLVLDSTHFRTLAISHQWRDDVTTVKMIQSLIEIEED